jgi:hypothetical protein
MILKIKFELNVNIFIDTLLLEKNKTCPKHVKLTPDHCGSIFITGGPEYDLVITV